MTVRISATDWVEGGIDGRGRGARSPRPSRTPAPPRSTSPPVRSPRTSARLRPVATRRPSPTRSATGSASPPSPSASSRSWDDVNSIVLAGRADLCAVGRAHLYDPNWTLHAAVEQDYDGPGAAVADAVARRPPQAADRPHRRPEAAPAAGPRGRDRRPGTPGGARMTPEPSALPAPTSPLAALWAARSVAVVGASDRPGSLGRLPVEFLQRYGYAGRILPVRPDGAPVAGLPSHPSLRECRQEHGPVDLAMVMVAAPPRRWPPCRTAPRPACPWRSSARAGSPRRARRAPPCRTRWSAPPARAGCGWSAPTASAASGWRPDRSAPSRRCSPASAPSSCPGPSASSARAGRSATAPCRWPSSAAWASAGSSTPATRPTSPPSRSWTH